MGQEFQQRGDNKVLKVKEKVRARTNGFKFDKFRFKKDIGKNSFTNRIVKEWNILSKHVVSAGQYIFLRKGWIYQWMKKTDGRC